VEAVTAILTATGIPVTRDRLFSQADAELLRKYKKFLLMHNLREKLWCVKCEDAEDHPGLRASVTDSKIDFACRCTVRRYRGQTY
jgi:hypothetical protein